MNNNGVEEKTSISYNVKDLVDDTKSIKERFDILKALLNDSFFQNKFGKNNSKALLNRLSKYQEAYESNF
jgi:hypothetical protein